FAVMAGVRVKPITTYPEDGFRLPDRAAFERVITPRTRALMICNPGNPTGVVYTREEVQRLVDLAVEKGLFLIADEVYREFIFDGARHVSALSFPEAAEHVLMVDSISKRYSACGARIGFVVSRNRRIMDAILRFGQARLCSPTLEQVGATAALDMSGTYLDEMIGEYGCRRDVVYEALMKMPGVLCKKPQGAFYCIAKLPVRDAEAFAVWLLRDFDDQGETVMVAPAAGFYATPGLGTSEVRIAYVLNCDALGRAMEILARALEIYRKREE
ncbi:pyridoxal phosphate-dependent aminotransferase, partial [bacterium]|nr:pyridoxal phosphate-dependent aminotransferase [candidate division CSSED10-310 bacterium]